MKNVGKHKDIRLVTTGKKGNIQCWNQIITQQNGFQKIYQQLKRVKMNKPIYLGLSILILSKTVMHEI